jgi:hypothetical protein
MMRLSAQTLSVGEKPRGGIAGLRSFGAFVGGVLLSPLPRLILGEFVGEPGCLLQHLSSVHVRLREASAKVREVFRGRMPREVCTLVHGTSIAQIVRRGSPQPDIPACIHSARQ